MFYQIRYLRLEIIFVSVTANELGKRLCFRTFPEMASLIGVANTSKEMVNPVEVESNSEEWAVLKRDQQLYASLLNALTKSEVYSKDFITYAVSATSTDNYPAESVVHTLNPKDKLGDDRPSYWSSKGQSNPDVPETLIYKLHEGMWLLMGVDLQPFEGKLQSDFLSLLLLYFFFPPNVLTYA